MKAKPSINPAAKTAAVTGSGVDLAGYEGTDIFVHVGAWSDGSFPLALMESADNVTYTAVAASDIIGSQPTISGVSNNAYQYGYKGNKRYLRVDTGYAQGAGSTGAIFGALIVRGFSRRVPVS
jgi:hypothetical protein